MNESTPLPKLPSDSLGKFLADAHYNTAATAANFRQHYEPLAAIDRMYCDMVDNLNQSPELFAAFFLIRAHSSFRGAARMCLSGQLAETYTLLRSCIESALYGLYVAGDASRQQIWLRRHVDDASRRRVRNEFTIRNVLDHLRSIDPKAHGVAQLLYDRAIDYGGHPNERAVTTQIKTEAHESRVDFTADYFICRGLPHQASLRSCAQTGICCLDVFYFVFRDRYRLLGMDERLAEIRQRF